MTNGWGGRINYTYSRLKDNQFGEGNFFSRQLDGEAQNAYNIDAEYAIGLLDVPHKIVVSPIFELPFGEGKRWAQGRRRRGASSATGRSRRSSRFESGFPIVVQRELQRPRSVSAAACSA